VSNQWRDYYRILGVRSDATQNEIKEAWIFGVKAFHPDKFAGSSQRQQAVAQERTKAVNEAYYVLSDATRRADYDREYVRKTRAESTSPPPQRDTSRAYTSAKGNAAQATSPPKTASEKNRNAPLSTVLSGASLYVAWLIAAAMLVSAAVERHPYSFYMLLRWVCCGIFAYSAFAAHEKNRLVWVWVFGVLAALYNPIVLVHLDRTIWTRVNWFTVGAIIIAAVVFLQDKKSLKIRPLVLATVLPLILVSALVLFAIFTMRQPRNAITRPTTSQSPMAETTQQPHNAIARPTISESPMAHTAQQPQSQAQDFIVIAKDATDGLILWVQERDSGRLLLNTITEGIALNGDLNTGRRAALTVTSQHSGANMPIASGAFMIVRDAFSNGVYEASVHRGRPAEIETLAPEEQARVEAWERQFQPTPCVRDPSLPMDTVRLEPGAESKIRPGYFFPTRPAQPPNYVPTLYVPAKVLRNDGAFLGWQYFSPAQLKRLHEQPNAVSGRG
jgi:DnaJ domain